MNMFTPTVINHVVPPPTNPTAVAFQEFFNHWLVDQQCYLRELRQLIENNEKDGSDHHEVDNHNLVNRVIGHYDEYYEAKERLVRHNVFLTLYPTWYTAFECDYFWLGGYRPRITSKLVENSVLDLTEEQSERIKALKIEFKEEEQALTDEHFRIQDEGAPAMIQLVMQGRPRNGEAAYIESAIERLKASMTELVLCSDVSRMKSISRLRETLKPFQMVRFLAALTQMRLELRCIGMCREARERNNVTTRGG